MSVATTGRPPRGDSPQRTRAKETVWRLSALAFGHPTEEFYKVLTSGDFHAAFSMAWADVTGGHWPATSVSPDYQSFEAGYIGTFQHGRDGKPIAALLAGEHEYSLAGLTRPVFMLNVAAFYRHFGLKPATRDEGKSDEPDHLVSMLELMAVLCHLEANAIQNGCDPSPYMRAQRDFLCRYLGRLLVTIGGLLRRTPSALDPTLAQLAQDLSSFSDTQITELEIRVGPFRDPDAPKPSHAPIEAPAQNLWG